MDPRFKHPFTCLVAGPTGSGKTTFVRRLLQQRNEMISPVPNRVLWCYGVWQAAYDRMTDLVDEWVEGLPDPTQLMKGQQYLVIVDDLMTEMTGGHMTTLFTKTSHHADASIVYIVQNLFHKGKEQRTISLNSHYLVLFKNPRDASQISHLAKQMYPSKVESKFLQEAFADATAQPFGYLLIDLKQSTPDWSRVRTAIFPDDRPTFVYMPRH